MSNLAFVEISIAEGGSATIGIVSWGIAHKYR